MKINNFRGDLTDISAKKEALGQSVRTMFLTNKIIVVYRIDSGLATFEEINVTDMLATTKTLGVFRTLHLWHRYP